MSFFDKVARAAVDTASELKARSDRRKVLQDLTESQLYELGIEYGVPLTRGMSKEQMISQLAACKKLSIKVIMKEGRGKMEKTARVRETKKAEDLEIEQEIVRTEKITTKISKKKEEITYDSEVRKVLEGFKPIIRAKTKESDVEAQIVQTLRAVVGPDNVDYQQKARSGRLDIVVGRDIGIELKLMYSPSQLKALQGQLFDYSKEYKNLLLDIRCQPIY